MNYQEERERHCKLIQRHAYMVQVYDPTSDIHQMAYRDTLKEHRISMHSRPKGSHQLWADKLYRMGYGIQLEEARLHGDDVQAHNTLLYSALTFDIYIGDILVGKCAGNTLFMGYLLPGITFQCYSTYDMLIADFRKDYDKEDLQRTYEAIQRMHHGVEMRYDTTY